MKTQEDYLTTENRGKGKRVKTTPHVLPDYVTDVE